MTLHEATVLEKRYCDVVAILWDKFKVQSPDDISKVLYAVDCVCLHCGTKDEENPSQVQPCKSCGKTRWESPGSADDTKIIGSLGPAPI